MKKYFYFSSCVLSLLLMNTLGLIGMDVRNMLAIGLTVLFCFVGVILFELLEQRLCREKAEESILIRLYKIENLLQLLRNTQLDKLNNDILNTTATAETLKIIGELCAMMKTGKEKASTGAEGEENKQQKEA